MYVPSAICPLVKRECFLFASILIHIVIKSFTEIFIFMLMLTDEICCESVQERTQDLMLPIYQVTVNQTGISSAILPYFAIYVMVPY